jgi:hypothetical protein
MRVTIGHQLDSKVLQDKMEFQPFDKQATKEGK